MELQLHPGGIEVVLLSDDALVSWEYVQQMLEYTDTQRDRIIRLINWISSRAIAVAGREIVLKMRTYTTSGVGTSRIYLPVVPVDSVDSVIVDDGHIFDNTPLDANEYHVSSNNGIITR